LKKETKIAIFSSLGLVISIILCFIYYQSNYNPYSSPSFCSINEVVDCDGVAQTSKSVFLGVPLSWWGVILYSFILMLLNVEWLKKIRGFGILKVFKRPLDYISALGLIAFVISIFLAITSFFVIHKICILCFVTYFLNLIISIVSTDFQNGGFKTSFQNSFEDFISGVREESIPFVIALLISGLFLSYTTYQMPFASRKQSIKHYLMMKHNLYSVSGNVLGSKDGKYRADIYTDFVCPICHCYNIMLHKLVKENKCVYVVHHNFPLDTECNPYLEKQMHEGACRMARYGISAENQGKYWDMANLLFENKPKNDEEAIKLAKQIGLNVERFRSDINSKQTLLRLQSEIDTAISDGIDGTPTLIVNDEKYTGAKPYYELKRIILRK
jgi:protein-disulfide isomerase/uncharacterized membrane protein